MKAKRLLILFLALLLASLTAAGASARGGRYGEIPPARTVLTFDQAQAWAQAWVHRKQGIIPAWRGATVGKPEIYYDLDGRPAVYVFSVYKGAEDVGHIIISYEAKENPVLVFGKGVAPHLRCPECVNEAALAQRGLRLAERRMIYLGPLDYFYEVEPIDPILRSQNVRDARRLLIPMGGDQTIEVQHAPSSEPVIDVPTDHLPDLDAIGVASAATAVKIFGVPDYDQFTGSDYGYDYDCASGCVPTSAANIVHFWDQAGYKGLAYEDWRDTIYYLRNYMETFCSGGAGATRTDKVRPGLIEYAQSRGFDFGSKYTCWPGSNWLDCTGEARWDVYTTQIDRFQPVLVALTNDYYGSHGVTGVGYDTDGGEYWIVHDNWPITPEDVWVLSTEVESRHYYTFVPPSQDTTSPTASISAPSYQHVGTSLRVAWKGEDDFSGVARYDVQYQFTAAAGTPSASAAAWTDWFTSTTQQAGQMDVSQPGTYAFRVRAYDWMGNVSDWTAPIQTQVYRYDLSGRVLGNREHWIPAAKITAADQALGSAYSGYNGSFTLRIWDAVTTSLAITRTGFGQLPLTPGVEITRDVRGWLFVLPPADNLVSNGDFENGLWGWSVGGPAGMVSVVTGGHTGGYAAYLRTDGTSTGQLVQAIPTTVPTDTPTLSLMYAVSGTTSLSSCLQIHVQGPSASRRMTVPLGTREWSHAWMDLQEFAGGSVTITIALSGPPTTGALVDEVSLGEGSTEAAASFLPLVMRSW